jgi:hypothetical protein
MLIKAKIFSMFSRIGVDKFEEKLNTKEKIKLSLVIRN